jgi:hypothetical protein
MNSFPLAFFEKFRAFYFIITTVIKISEYFLSTRSRGTLIMDVLAEEIDFLKRDQNFNV